MSFETEWMRIRSEMQLYNVKVQEEIARLKSQEAAAQEAIVDLLHAVEEMRKERDYWQGVAERGMLNGGQG